MAVIGALRRRILQPGANPGLSVLFDGLVVLTRLTGGKQDDRTEAEMRSLSGAFNYELTGPGGATWQMIARDGHWKFHRGPHPSPRATVSMSVDELFKLLTGQASFLVSEMTGKVRIAGDGHAGMLVGALLGALRQGRRKSGRQGRFMRGWTDLALRLSHTGYTFKE